jgi:hypothetical protein
MTDLGPHLLARWVARGEAPDSLTGTFLSKFIPDFRSVPEASHSLMEGVPNGQYEQARIQRNSQNVRT